MLAYYCRTALRSLRKNPFYAAISIIGLVTGLGAFVLLIDYTHKERSYDSTHADGDRIYRVESYFVRNGQVTDSWASSTFGYAPAMKKEFPEIQEIVRVDNYDCERVVRYQERVYREPRVVFADSNFFRFFSYPLLRGRIDEVLREPNSIVISESAARKYFGHEDPMGRIMHISTIKSKFDCAVTGIFKDFPANSTLHLDLMMSYMTSTPWEREFWYMHEAYTYLKAASPAAAASIEQKFPALAEKYKTLPALKEHSWDIHLVPLAAIHLNAAKPYELETKGSPGTIAMLRVIAYVILIISWINYINLFISRAMERAGEIGVRKMAGATFGDILLQFMTEACLINFSSFLLFFAVMAALIPLAGLFSLSHLFEGFWEDPLTWKMSIAAFFTGTLATGLIPAVILKSINTGIILKNRLAFRSGLGQGLRKGLVVFQYFASIVLIVSTLTIRQQISFMQSQDLGVTTAQTLVFQTPPGSDSTYDVKMLGLKDALKNIGGIRMVTQSSAVPGKMAGYGMANRRVGAPDNTNKMCETIRVDYDFLPAYGLQLLKGRNFSREYPLDKEECVILTENAMQLFGFNSVEEAMKGSVYLEGQNDKRFRIIGVTRDYHQQSLKETYRPIVFTVFNPWHWIDNHYVSLKLDGGTPAQIVEGVRRKFKDYFPESSFDYFFLNDYFNRQYQQDISYGRIILFFSILALCIVCLGIIGISGFMLLKRKKEIGIRKVSGAGTTQILQLLNMHFLKLVAIAFAVAVPVAWINMHHWLQNFASRVSIDPLVFLAAIAITSLVTILTVSLQSYKIASTRPADALRYE